ncbi:MAG: hypothetical protein Q7J10_04365 [Methanosarcinaceae archaeon]|nr:hypothetical protein [Methanosarcinaceae archaeon]
MRLNNFPIHIQRSVCNCFPVHPHGCISQAWSVAEVLRAYVEEVVRGEEI